MCWSAWLSKCLSTNKRNVSFKSNYTIIVQVVLYIFSLRLELQALNLFTTTTTTYFLNNPNVL